MVRRKNRSWAALASRWAAFGRGHLALALLVAADVMTKQLAFRLLPGGKPEEISRGVGFYLTMNEWGVLGGVDGVATVTTNSVYTLLLAVALLGLALMVRKLDATGLSFALRMLVGTLVFALVSNLVALAARPFAYVSLPPDLVINAIRASVLVVSVAFYSVSRATMARVVFTLLVAGSLANGLSYIYPPFEVIDFLRIPLPGNPDAFGVINLADVYIALSIVALAAWPLVALAGWLRRLGRGAVSSKRGRKVRLRRQAAAAEIAD